MPDVTIYAAPAKRRASGVGRTVDLTQRRDPLFVGRLNPDLRFFGFDLPAGTVRGVGPADGWYFVFQEHPTAVRFGLDEYTGNGPYGTQPATWQDLNWSQVVTTQEAYDALVYL